MLWEKQLISRENLLESFKEMASHCNFGLVTEINKNIPFVKASLALVIKILNSGTTGRAKLFPVLHL